MGAAEPERPGAAADAVEVEVGWPEQVDGSAGDECHAERADEWVFERSRSPRLDVGDDRVFLDSVDDPTGNLAGSVDEPTAEDLETFRLD